MLPERKRDSPGDSAESMSRLVPTSRNRLKRRINGRVCTQGLNDASDIGPGSAGQGNEISAAQLGHSFSAACGQISFSRAGAQGFSLLCPARMFGLPPFLRFRSDTT